MKKRIVSVLLVVIMILACGATAFADVPAAKATTSQKAATLDATFEVTKDSWSGSWLTLKCYNWLGVKADLIIWDSNERTMLDIESGYKGGTIKMWTSTSDTVYVEWGDFYQRFSKKK